MKVRIPIWKAYIYSLIHRYRLFVLINKSRLEFGMSNKEKGLLHRMIHTYLRKEVHRKLLAIQYHHLVEEVLVNRITIATKPEIQLANKLFIAYQINSRSIPMEIKELKKFAKEVGLDAKAIKGLDEEELCLEIVRSVDAEKAYSDEFIAWYETLPEEMFDSADAVEEESNTKGKKAKKGKEEEPEEETDFSDLIDAIEDSTDKEELTEICEDEDFEFLFGELDPNDYKTTKKLKAAMLEAIEDFQDTEKEEEPEEEEIDKEDSSFEAELIEAIDDAESAEDLKEIADTVKEDNPELFKGISFRKGRGKSPYRTDVKAIKKEMLSRLDSAEKEPEEEVEESGEIEITAELVQDAVDAEDREALVAMCEQLGIELKALEKRSYTRMSEKVLAVLEKNKPAKKTRTKKEEPVEEVEEETEEKQSVFQLVEEMVESGEDEKAIVKAVLPILEERGKKKLFVTKWVKQAIAVVESLQ